MDLAAHFEELMQRSPIPQQEITNFLREMRRTSSGTVTVSKLLAAKIQSSSEAQAIQAFNFLEAALESETEGSIEFRTEIGRYRFLNEIIRVLSPKYLGERTPEAVKERAVKFLEDAAGGKRKRWFPSEHSKVNSVYQSLVDGGIIQKTSKLADEDAEFQKSIFERGENAVILKRLLQSKDPSDLQAANRLIKNLVEEEARRNERRAELHSLIDRIETSTGLLTEMLTQPNIDKEIVDELVDTCRSLRQKLGGVATETSDEVTSLLQASENIEQVLILYESKKDTIGKTISNTDENTDSTEVAAAASIVGSELSLADQLLMNLGDDKINGVIQQQSQQHKSKIGDDGDNLLNLDIEYTPVVPVSQKLEVDADKYVKPEAVEPFDEISKLSREMMEQGLKGMPNSSLVKKTDKIPLSKLKRPTEELLQPALPQSSTSAPALFQSTTSQVTFDPMSLLDFDFLEKPSPSSSKIALSTSSSNLNTDMTPKSDNCHDEPKPRLSSFQEDENLLLVLENDKSSVGKSPSPSNGINHSNSNTSNNNQTVLTNEDGNPVRNGVGIKNNLNPDPGFSLNSVRDLDLEKIDLIDDLKPVELNFDESCKDVALTLTFGKYPDFPDTVTVAVVSLTNRNKSTGLFNYVFQLMPPKGLQVKLLPPVCMELPPWKKTFLPPPILTQVALIMIPVSVKTKIQPKIKFILSYCLEDETMVHNGDFSIPSLLLQ